MSGPKTYSYDLADATSVSAAELVAIAAENAAREAERRAQERMRLEALAGARTAERRIEQLQNQIVALNEKYGQTVLPITVSTIHRPSDETTDALQHYTQQLQANARNLEQKIISLKQKFALDSLVQEQDAFSGPDAKTIARDELLKSLLTPIEGDSEGELPAELHTAIERFRAAPEAQAAEAAIALQREIRRVQRTHALSETVRVEIETLLSALVQVDAPRSAHLREQLEAVYTGDMDWSEALCGEAHALVDAQNRAEKDAAAAEIISSALKDLGYDVGPIENTLFVEGGSAFFQRPEWGDYYVCMRVDPQERLLNFNMVRTSEQPGTPGSASQLQKDVAMESAWCARLGGLTDTFQAHGIRTNLVRQKHAGEIPVQQIQRDRVQLPARRRAEDERSGGRPKPVASNNQNTQS